jgi:glycosyltransferase involved in cell wall biosynthesis
MPDVTVVVPVRNAAAILEQCLESIASAQPREIVIVDGLSTDETLEIAGRYPAKILSDEGKGLPAARMMGAREAESRWIALVDADVVFPEGALEHLLDEFVAGGYTALQAGLESTAGPGYWGQALANHHRTGRSKRWFGLVATIMERDAFLAHGLDEGFLSGEDIELRWRLAEAGTRTGVSERTIVEHRFGDTFGFAKGQFTADGHGLGRMITKHGWKAAHLGLLPLAAGVRGILLSLTRRQPRWIPYYAAFVVFNYGALFSELGGQLRSRQRRRSPARQAQ